MKLDDNSFIKYINKNFLFEKNPKIAVAVSGGPDSIALLYLLNEWSKNVKGAVIALIVDHKLRDESLKEAITISKLLKKKYFNTKILKISKNKIIKKTMNEARINRYDLITDYCNSKNILHLFVGHQKDDDIETFLNRKISGSDFEGLKSIKEISLKNQVCIIRPLLKFSKKQIVNYNNLNRISFIEDPSNSNFNFTRPVIRKFLKECNSLVKNEINKEFLEIQRHSILYDKMISEVLIKNIIEARKDSIKIGFDNFVSLDILISEKIVKRIFNYLNNQQKFLKSKKIQIFIKYLNNKNFKFFDLKSMIIEKVNDCLIFYKKTN